MERYEMEYDAQIQIEEKLRKQDLSKFAEWLGNNKFKYDGVSIWKRPRSTAGNGIIKEYFSTLQVIEKFLKEN
jgi:hypothetical protein